MHQAGCAAGAVGYHAYVAAGPRGLRIIDVSDPTEPQEVGFYDTLGITCDVYASGVYAYVADWNGGLYILQYGGSVMETSPWDVNKDEVVDIVDIVLVGRHFGESVTTPLDPNPDVNGDGIVNIQDIVLVGQHFGETYQGSVDY